MVRFPQKCSHFLIAFSTFLFLTIQDGMGQYFFTGTDPASVRWRQIKTPNFNVIYPRTWESQAQYIANGLEYIYLPGSKSMYPFTPKTPVIIHSRTTQPTSATYIAPRRMDFFTAPPQDLYPQDWIDGVIIHEFRHAVLYSAVNCGVTKGLSYVLGEQGVFAMFAILPMWFIEGDPTVAETALHNTGRGRTPSLEIRLRAQFVQKGIYSYEKANFGSFRDLVPGKYELGYQLVGLSRVNFGSSMWSKVVENVGRRPYTIVPFSSAIKKQTGYNKYQLYDVLTKQLQKSWLDEDKLIQENKYQILTSPAKKLYTNYNLPTLFRDSMIIAVKSSMDELTKIVLINKNGKEKDLCKAGVNYYQESLTASDSIIYWSELVNDPRWTLRDYRVIKFYNFNTEKTGQLTHLTRYYAPAITHDGKSLAAVEVTPENRYYLVILNLNDGSIIRKISTPDNLLFIHPRWSDDGKSIVSIVLGKDGNNLAVTDTETGKTELLLPFSSMEMKRPSFYRKYILYTASYNGKDNIYAFNRNTKEVSRVTSARFGASDAIVANSQAVIYSNYTADGYSIVKENLDPSAWTKISIPVKSAFPIAEKLTQQENFIYNRDSVPKITYKSKPYYKVLNQFNFHSWIPIDFNIGSFSVNPGITLMSQNLLETTLSSMGYLFNRNERTSKYFFSMSNESLYPAIDLSVDYAGRKDFGYYATNNYIQEKKWNELNLSAGLRLPLNWTHNSWLRSFQPGISLNWKQLKMEESLPVTFDHSQIIALDYSLKASNTIKTSLRDIYPRWGQKLQLNFSSTPWGSNINSVFAGQLTMDFPGIGRHHGLQLYGGYQKKNIAFYSFSDIINFPRGYTEIFRNEISSFSAMYSMPLFYPEWQIANLMYFKRFKTSIFYDFAQSTGEQRPGFFSSIGIELTSDFTIFNFIIPLEAGLRAMYLPENKSIAFGLIFFPNMGGMY